jgi:hypothetical protein
MLRQNLLAELINFNEGMNPVIRAPDVLSRQREAGNSAEKIKVLHNPSLKCFPGATPLDAAGLGWLGLRRKRPRTAGGGRWKSYCSVLTT